jgi:hypothetical protein
MHPNVKTLTSTTTNRNAKRPLSDRHTCTATYPIHTEEPHPTNHTRTRTPSTHTHKAHHSQVVSLRSRGAICWRIQRDFSKLFLNPGEREGIPGDGPRTRPQALAPLATTPNVLTGATSRPGRPLQTYTNIPRHTHGAIPTKDSETQRRAPWGTSSTA